MVCGRRLWGHGVGWTVSLEQRELGGQVRLGGHLAVCAVLTLVRGARYPRHGWSIVINKLIWLFLDIFSKNDDSEIKERLVSLMA